MIGLADRQKVAITSISCLLVLSIVSKLLHNDDRDGNKKSYSHARSLVNQAVRWNSMAEQDTNPLFAMRHMNYATAYLSAARSMVSDAGLEQATGRNIHNLSNYLNKSQQRTMGLVGKSCPKTLPKGTTVTNWLD